MQMFITQVIISNLRMPNCSSRDDIMTQEGKNTRRVTLHINRNKSSQSIQLAKFRRTLKHQRHGNITSQCVFQHIPAHDGCDSRRSSHARTGVDLDQPRLTVFGQHEIGAVQFERALRSTNGKAPVAVRTFQLWLAHRMSRYIRGNIKSGTGSSSSAN